ncbi:MAG: lipid II flippase MurJ [Patescibacteria group bacterium]
MGNRILKLFHQEIAGVHQAAFLIGFFTFLSQVLALVRDRILANHFGAGQTLDIYYAAFRIPDLIYAAVASLVSISVLIPFFSGIFERKKEEAAHLMSTIFTVFVGLMIVVSVVFWFIMPYITPLLMPGMKDPAVLDQLTLLARLLLLQPICLGISNLLGVITQISKRFFLYAMSPILYNLSIIFGLLFLYPIMGIQGVVVGVIIGGLVHFLVQVPFVAARGLLPRITFNIDRRVVWEMFKLSIPRTLTLSATNLELVFITSFASLITTGSIAIFSFSNSLQSVPFAIVGVSYALAAFPTLSAFIARGERAEFIEHVTTAARHIVFWSIPITALFIVLRAQIVRVILGSGSFDWDDTRLTAACLALFTISLVAQGLELLFIRAYYAAGMTKKPLFINLISSVITIGAPFFLLMAFNNYPMFKYVIESAFRVEDIPGAGVLMLPLGFSIGTLINAFILWISFERDFGSLTHKVGKVLFSSFSAGVIGAFFAYIALNTVDERLNLDTFGGILTQGIIGGAVGIGITMLVFKLLGSTELGEVWRMFNQKLTKNKVVVAEPEKIEI